MTNLALKSKMAAVLYGLMYFFVQSDLTHLCTNFGSATAIFFSESRFGETAFLNDRHGNMVGDGAWPSFTFLLDFMWPICVPQEICLRQTLFLYPIQMYVLTSWGRCHTHFNNLHIKTFRVKICTDMPIWVKIQHRMCQLLLFKWLGEHQKCTPNLWCCHGYTV